MLDNFKHFNLVNFRHSESTFDLVNFVSLYISVLVLLNLKFGTAAFHNAGIQGSTKSSSSGTIVVFSKNSAQLLILIIYTAFYGDVKAGRGTSYKVL